MAKYKIIPSSRTIVQSPISIGHKAEKGVEAIEFDLTAWVETYGSGTLTVIMRRWGDAAPYPIALEIDENNKATWTLSDTDTAKAGMAYAQLSYIVGDEVVKKSDIYTFRVMDSLTGEGEPPEAYESWLEQLTHLAAEAMAEVLDIEGIVTDKTLTIDGGIADGKATGDALSALEDQFTEETDQLKADLANATGLISVEWEQGGIAGNTGESTVSETRIRTSSVLDARIETLSIESGYEFALCAWNGDTYIGQWNRTNKTWAKGTLFASTSINLNEIRASYNGYYYKVVVRKSSNTSIAVSESNNFSYYPFSDVDINSKDIETIHAKLSSTEALIDAGYSESKIQGGFVLGGTGNGSLIVSSTNNMVTSDVQTVADDCVLTTDWSKYKIYIWQVENNTWDGLGWFFADYTLSAGFSGRFVVRGVTMHDFTTAEQEEINNVTVYARTTTLKNRIDSIDIGKSDFISICHQGYSDSMAINQSLLSGFKKASEHGFEYAETDVVLSSNGVVMCCHDNSFVDATTGDTIVISEHTDTELKTYDYYGGTISTLDEIMSACKTNRIGLVIDHATGTLLPYIYPTVSKYGMQDSVIYLIGWAVGNENYAKNMYNSIIAFYKRSKVMFMAGTSSLSEVKTFLSTLDTGFATVYITLNHANYPVADIITLTQDIPGEITVAVWTIDNLATAKSYMPHVTAITSNKFSSRDIFA